MIGSLFTAITGLQTFQQYMNVISNNIANVNTVGYKDTETNFESMISQTMRSASAPSATSGGSDPRQVGLGVQVGGNVPIFTQGSAQTTGKPTDLMIQGAGFFEVNNNGATYYTRNGAFDRDANGNIVNPSSGMLLMGFQAQGTPPAINTNAPVGPINIPPTYASFNIGSDGTVTGIDSTGSTTVLGQVALVNFPNPSGLQAAGNSLFTPTLNSGAPNTNTNYPSFTGTTAANSTQVVASYSAQPTVPSLFVPAGTPALPTGVSVGGALSTSIGGPITSLQISFDSTAAGLATNGKISINGQAFTATNVTTTGNAPPATPGTITFTGGTIPSTLTVYLGQALPASTTGFVLNLGNSGGVNGVPGTNGLGTVTPGALEMSNVDLSREFSNMIIAERGYEANSKVITTSDSILMTLVNMKSQA